MVAPRYDYSRLIGGVLSVLVAACGGSDPTGGPTGQDLSFMEGAWSASVFQMTSQQNPALRVDVLASGGEFRITIERDGRYVAELEALGQSNVERGSITRSGTQLVLSPVSPPGQPERVDWRIIDETLVLDGPSEFDFDLDLSPEPAMAHIELVRR